MHSKENVKFSDVSVWMRTFRKMLENASVDVFMCIWINVDRCPLAVLFAQQIPLNEQM